MKMTRKYARLELLIVPILFVAAAGIGRGQQPSIKLINMIPREWSYETNQDSEPNLAVNATNINQLAGSAFTPGTGFCAPNVAPIFVSLNGGNSWAVRCLLPSDSSGVTSDITLGFSHTNNTLYAAIFRRPVPPFGYRLNILRTSDFNSPALMKVLVDRKGVDQPYIHTSSSAGRDRIYIGNNDFAAPNGKTATIDYSLDAAADIPVFEIARIESRDTHQQNGPATRIAVHPDGTAYALFYGFRTIVGAFWSSALITTDVVVVRDDNGASSNSKFADLKDADGFAGFRVARDRQVPWNLNYQRNFGNQRFVASNISIAVDPRPGKSGTVYVAWADRSGADDYSLHVRRSTDRGATWSSDLKSVTNATNPALAISSDGTVGFLYQQLSGPVDAPRWETHIELTTAEAAFASGQNYLLATVPATKPDPKFSPYIGDYIHLMTVGKDFYGVFSANNTPNRANFPNNVTYQRNISFDTQQLFRDDNVTPVPASIDPFFFKIMMP